MPIARLSRTDPATGETVYFEQPYTPGPDPAQQAWLEEQAQQRQQQQMMRMAMEAKTAEAAKAVQSAIQFQATRQFLNDIKNGMPREEALARNAWMFYSNPEAALKATEPQESYQWNPPSNGAPGYFGGARGTLRPYVPSGGGADNLPVQWNPEPGANYVTRGGAVVPPRLSPTQLAEKTRLENQMKLKQAKFEKSFNDPDVEKEALDAMNSYEEGIRNNFMPKKAAPLSEQAANFNPTKTPMTGDVYKGYRFKGGDPSKKENWEKAQ